MTAKKKDFSIVDIHIDIHKELERILKGGYVLNSLGFVETEDTEGLEYVRQNMKPYKLDYIKRTLERLYPGTPILIQKNPDDTFCVFVGKDEALSATAHKLVGSYLVRGSTKRNKRGFEVVPARITKHQIKQKKQNTTPRP